VASGDSGVNKPYDRLVKALADGEPALFLWLLGAVPAGVQPDLQPLRPETAPSIVFPDYVAIWQASPQRRVILHVEFYSNYRRGIPADMARYGASLAWQDQLPVESILVLMRPARAPRQIPEIGHYNIGATETRHPFRVVRLWEIDPSPVVETHNPLLLPWALLMKSSDELIRQVAVQVARSRDGEAIARFLTLGSLRYNRKSLVQVLGERSMPFVQAIVEGSSIFREARLEVASSLIRIALSNRFPGLENLPEIDAIHSMAAMKSLMQLIQTASDPNAIRKAILKAARPGPSAPPITPS
jgi:hypothetical protein